MAKESSKQKIKKLDAKDFDKPKKVSKVTVTLKDEVYHSMERNNG